MYDPLDVCIGCFLVIHTLLLIDIIGMLREIKERLDDDRCQR